MFCSLGSLNCSLLFQALNYEIPAAYQASTVVDWPQPLPSTEWEVKPAVGLRSCKGSMGLRSWLPTDWIHKQPVALGGFVADTQLPRGKLLALPLGGVGTGPQAATHWVCPCGFFAVPRFDDLGNPANKDRLVSACGLLSFLQTFSLLPVDWPVFRISQRFGQHTNYQRIERATRGTDGDWGTCCLLPGEQGQWPVQGMGYGDSTPHLYCWGAIMGMEGTPFEDQRQLLTCLGWIVPFRFKEGKKVVKPLVR